MVFFKETVTNQSFSAVKDLSVHIIAWIKRPRNKDIKCTHRLFIDNLKVNQESHKVLKEVNKTVLQASHDTGAS